MLGQLRCTKYISKNAEKKLAGRIRAGLRVGLFVLESEIRGALLLSRQSYGAGIAVAYPGKDT